MKRIIFIITIIALASCTENSRARKWGGTENVKLKPNEVLVNITWKESSLWILTRDTTTNISYFRESSSYGVWEGKIIIKESK